MDKIDESHQEEIGSLHKSRLAGQIDQKDLPFIHFLPASGTERKNWHQSGENSLCWNFFEKIVQCQSTSSDELTSVCQIFLEQPFHEQLATFQLSQQLTQGQRRIRWQIAVDLLSAIRNNSEHKNCDATVYGSLATGLSSPVSDIDISVDIDGDNGQALESMSKEERTEIISDFRKKIRIVLKNAPSLQDPAQKLFSTVSTMSGGHSKYIWLQEAETGIIMDLTFHNQLCIHSTKLFQFYMNFEPRTKQLIIFLNFWARFHQICGSCALRKSSLTILILVFLMEKNIIPSVLLLQAIATFQRSSERGEMEVPNAPYLYFCDDHEVISKYFTPAIVSVPMSTPQEDSKIFLHLLADFFKMVMKTTFSTSLVSPQLGTILRKEDVTQTVSKCVNALPTEVGDCWKKLYPTYFDLKNLFSEDVAVFIQDPFELEDNTAKLCSEKSRDEFVSVAKYTLSILSNNPSSLLDLFVSRSDVIRREFAAITQRSRNDEYFNVLLEMILKPEPEDERILKENTDEFLHALQNISLVPDGFFKDTEEFDAIRLDRTLAFLDSYLVKLYSWEMLGGSDDVSSWQIKLQVIALWRMFAMEFLKQFFTTGLCLTRESIEIGEVYVDCPVDLADTWTYDDAYTEENVTYFRKSLVQIALPEHVQIAKEKIAALLIPGTDIKYGGIKVEVTYPFWRRNYHKPISDLDVEANISEESFREYLRNINEIRTTGQPTGFIPFSIYVLYKLDTRADEASHFCTVPTISLMVQEFNEDDVPRDVCLERVLARKCVLDIFQRTFETYLLQKLASWSRF